jgi:hypothetical protein
MKGADRFMFWALLLVFAGIALGLVLSIVAP